MKCKFNLNGWKTQIKLLCNAKREKRTKKSWKSLDGIFHNWFIWKRDENEKKEVKRFMADCIKRYRNKLRGKFNGTMKTKVGL